MKIVRNVFCTDTPRRPFMHDEILSARNAGKQLALGTVWAGELRPLVDSTIAALEPLANGLTLGRTLHAQGPEGVLDLGKRWLGELRNRVADATRAFRASPQDEANAVNLAPLNAGIFDLSEALGSGDVSSLAWATDSLRRARDFLDAAAKHRTGDAGEWLTASDASSRQRVTAMNSAARTFWKERLPTARSGDATYRAPQGVSPQTTEVRNQVHAANRATSMPQKIAALNSAAKAFWAARG